MSALGLLTDALATYRLTKLVVDDEILADVRGWVWRRFPPETKLGYLLTCPWCMSIYLGGAVVTARTLAPRPWDLAARALSYSAFSGVASERF